MNSRLPALYGMAHIMRLAFAGDDLCELTAELVERLANDGHDTAAMLDLSVVQQLRGQHANALDLQWQALRQQQHFRLRSNPFRPAVRLLAIMGPGSVMDNTPLEFLVEDSDIAIELLYVGAGLPPVHDIPPHDVAFVAVCESDANQLLLRQLQTVMSYWPQPHLNSPERIATLARDGLSEVLSGLAGLQVVQSRRVSRQELTHPEALSLTYPLIVRPANSHAGRGLCKLDSVTDAARYLTEQDDTEFSIAAFVDYRSTGDNLYRKYRVASIAGQAYPAHMAVSPRWMVHYLNADMLENADNRAAEQRFMDHFDWEFAARHQTALAQINDRLGLDYYSIDCGETSDGQLLVFEIDSGAVVHAMDPIDVFPYKRPHMQKLFSAFQGLVKRTARGSGQTNHRHSRRRAA